MTETLDHKLATLKLGCIRQVYASWIEQAAQTEMGYGEFLEQLVTEEVLARQENQVRRKMHAAGFPYAATIDQFDFTLRPELKRTVMLRFFDSSFIATASSLVLIGASGLGRCLRHQDGAVGLQGAVCDGATRCQRRFNRYHSQRDHAPDRAACQM